MLDFLHAGFIFTFLCMLTLAISYAIKSLFNFKNRFLLKDDELDIVEPLPEIVRHLGPYRNLCKVTVKSKREYVKDYIDKVLDQFAVEPIHNIVLTYTNGFREISCGRVKISANQGITISVLIDDNIYLDIGLCLTAGQENRAYNILDDISFRKIAYGKLY